MASNKSEYIKNKTSQKNNLPGSQKLAGSENQQTFWQDAICDRCGKSTKVPFKPEEGRGIFCKECLREVRRQRALLIQTNKQHKTAHSSSHTATFYEKRDRKVRGERVSEEQKEKYKEDLRAMLLKIKAKEKES